MENAGWKVIKVKGDTKLNSDRIPHKVLNFITALKELFGEAGLPDFFIMKDTLVNGFFVEIKYKTNLTEKQRQTISILEKYLNVVSYVASNNEW